MTAMALRTPGPLPLAFLTWTARITSILSLALLAMFAFGGSEQGLPSMTEAVALALFPGAVALGMLLGWWRPLIGGVVCVAGLALFYAYMAAAAGRPVGGPWFIVFSAPGMLFLVCGLLGRAHHGRS